MGRPLAGDLSVINPDLLATMAVLAAVPGFEPGADPDEPLREALQGTGVVRASLRGIDELVEAATGHAAAAWKRLASDEIVEVAEWKDDPGLLARIGLASQLRTVVGLRPSPRPPDWRWPLRLGFMPGSEAFARRAESKLGWLDQHYDLVMLGRDGAECDIAVSLGAGGIDVYERSLGVRAGLLLVLERGAEIDTPLVARAAEGADAVDASGFSVVAGKSYLSFLEQLVVELSHAKELPLAVHGAAHTTKQRALLMLSPDLAEATDLRRSLPELARRAHRVRSDREFTVDRGVGGATGWAPGRRMRIGVAAEDLAERGDRLGFDREYDEGASAVSEVSRAIGQLSRQREKPRFLQAQVHLDATPRERTPVFVAGRRHVVTARVGSASTDWCATEEAFPDAGLFPRGVKTVVLDVGLVVPDLASQPVASSTITLKRTGDSTVCELPFDVPPGTKEVRATIIVSHGARVLQVGELRGPCLRTKPSGKTAAESRITFALQTVTSDGTLRVGQPEPDSMVTVLVGDTTAVVSGAPGAIRIDTANSGHLGQIGGAVATSLRTAAEGFQGAARKGSPLQVPQGVNALREMAVAGADLWAVMQSAEVNLAPLREAQRIRLVLTSEAPVLPLELVYDGGAVGRTAKPCAPTVAGCPCKGAPPKKSVICLRRFWGLSKLIERHAPTVGSGRSVSDPTKPASVLTPFTSALFASTTKVPIVPLTQLVTRVGGLVGKLDSVTTWDQWRRKAKGRTLLIGVVHNEIVAAPLSALEIGNGDLLNFGQLDAAIVGRGKRGIGPVVMLIGCRTALPDNPLVSFVSRLRQQGASVVVGSVADIPVDAAPELLMAVLDSLSRLVGSGRSTSLARAMRDARVKLLEDGWMLGMALVSYGDADWQLS